MNKHSTLEKQVDFLSEKGIVIDDMISLTNFLSAAPYQKSVNQLKIYYATSNVDYINNECFRGRNSNELISDYYRILRHSHHMLGKILMIENKIKNALFNDMNQLFEHNKDRYEATVLQILSHTKNAREYAFPNESDEVQIESLYTNKIYKVINAASMRELRDIFSILTSEGIAITNLKAQLEIIIPTNNRMKSVAKREYFNNINVKTLDTQTQREVKQIITGELVNLISEALKENIRPQELLESKENLIISKFSNTKKNQFFKSYQSQLVAVKGGIDSTKMRNTIKKELKTNDDFQNILDEFFKNQNSLIMQVAISELAKQSKLTNVDVASYRERISLNIWMENYILVKKHSTLASFRNTISHGNTLLITLKTQKEKEYLESIISSILTDKESDYKGVLYKNIMR